MHSVVGSELCIRDNMGILKMVRVGKGEGGGVRDFLWSRSLWTAP